jgi:uncharacterized protein YjbJ (UPF0337 family)
MTHYLKWAGEIYALRVEQMSSFVKSEPTNLLNKVAGRGAESRENQEAPNSSQTAVAGLNEALSQLFDDVIESGQTDQLRGYANEAMGETKLAIGRAVESPDLTFAGIAQVALGTIQRYVGEEKVAPDEECCAQSGPDGEGRSASGG